MKVVGLVAAAVLASVAPVSAADGWHWTTKAGYHYEMPPMSCVAGKHLPSYKVVYTTRKWLDVHIPHLHGRAPDGHPYHALAGLGWDDYGWTIYIDRALPKSVQADQLIHEQAHMLGCRHSDAP